MPACRGNAFSDRFRLLIDWSYYTIPTYANFLESEGYEVFRECHHH